MTKPALESVIDAMAELIGDWNAAAEDGDRGPDNKAIALIVWDDGSGKVGVRGWGSEVEYMWDFNNTDELIRLIEDDGVEFETVEHVK